MCRSILIQSSVSVLLMLLFILLLEMSRSKRKAKTDYEQEVHRRETCHSARITEHLRALHAHTLGWWNGRHVRLRGVCRKACGFKSRPEHDICTFCTFAI